MTHTINKSLILEFSSRPFFLGWFILEVNPSFGSWIRTQIRFTTNSYSYVMAAPSFFLFFLWLQSTAPCFLYFSFMYYNPLPPIFSFFLFFFFVITSRCPMFFSFSFFLFYSRNQRLPFFFFFFYNHNPSVTFWQTSWPGNQPIKAAKKSEYIFYPT